VRGLAGKTLKVEKSQNGDLRLVGSVEQLELRKTGNGEAMADSLFVQYATVFSSGNGSVRVHAINQLKADCMGNGDVINTGAGALVKGVSTGNGEILSGSEQAAASDAPLEFVEVTLVNKKWKSRDFTVRGRTTKKFSYGIEIGPQGRRKEKFPVGTKIETPLGQLIYTVQAADAGKTIEI
jgi:Putative auto-transporter adhesin, head GIN domain